MAGGLHGQTQATGWKLVWCVFFPWDQGSTHSAEGLLLQELVSDKLVSEYTTVEIHDYINTCIACSPAAPVPVVGFLFDRSEAVPIWSTLHAPGSMGQWHAVLCLLPGLSWSLCVWWGRGLLPHIYWNSPGSLAPRCSIATSVAPENTAVARSSPSSRLRQSYPQLPPSHGTTSLLWHQPLAEALSLLSNPDPYLYNLPPHHVRGAEWIWSKAI